MRLLAIAFHCRSRLLLCGAMLPSMLLLAACGGGGDPIAPGGSSNGGSTGGGGTPPVVASVTISPAQLSLTPGQTAPLIASAVTSSGASVAATFAWSSGDAAIASVSSAGLVTAVASGTTLIEARVGTVVGRSTVVVAPPTPAAPAAPSGLVSTRRRGEVELAWTDNSVGLAAHEIARRALPDTTFVPVGTAAAGQVRYVDTLELAADTLVYRVRAVAAGVASAFVSDTVVAPIPPLQVTVADVVRLLNTRLPSPAMPADGRDLGAELAAIVPSLLAHPDVITVLLQRETASAQLVLRDGLSLNVIHNKVPTAAELAAGAAMRLTNASAPRASWVRGGASHGAPAAAIPGTKHAGLISIGGGDEVLPEISDILTKGGYSPRTLGGSVEDMRGYKGLGALYFDSHGTAWRAVDSVQLDGLGAATGVSLGAYKYALETTTSVASADLGLYRTELERGDLTVNITPVRVLGVDLPIFDARFAITESFIARHWMLDDALVVLHTCFGGAGPFTSATCTGTCATAQASFYDPTPIRTALLAAGASVVQSYDSYVWPTSSLPSMAYFLDRLTGANVRTPSVTPLRRPFDLAFVRNAMGARGLLSHVRSATNAPRTTFDTSKPDAHIAGAPTIREIDVIDDAALAAGRFELRGTFGTKTGSVRVGGATASVSSWTATGIVAQAPFTGAGALGDVVVEAPGGLHSNVVPLTEWRGGLTLTVDLGQGTLRAEGQVDLRFRADVHKRRVDVEGTPAGRRVATYISPSTFGRVIGSGQNTGSNGTVTRFLGNREMRILPKATIDAGGSFSTTEAEFGGLVTVDVDAKQLELCFSISGPVTLRGEVPGFPPEERVVPILFVMPELVDSQRGVMSCLQLPMNESFGTSGGRRVTRQDEATITLEWTPFVASSPPTADTKG